MGTCPPPLPGAPPGRRTVANLPSHPRVKFLALNDSNPVAETAWSDPITLKTGTAAGVLVLPVASSRSRRVLGGCGVVLGGLHAEHQRLGAQRASSQGN